MSGSAQCQRHGWRHRRPGRRPVPLLWCVGALLFGILGMHGLTAVPPPAGDHAAAAAEHHPAGTGGPESGVERHDAGVPPAGLPASPADQGSCGHGDMPEHADPDCVSAAPPAGATVPAPAATPFLLPPDEAGAVSLAAGQRAGALVPTLAELQILRM